MNKNKFEKHINLIDKELKLGNEVKIFTGECSFCYANLRNKIYLENHQISLEKSYKRVNGLFLWWEKENTILLKRMKIGTLAHEMRHAWQYKNREEKYNYSLEEVKKECRNFKKIINYLASRKECDANNFALKYCFKTRLVLPFIWYLMIYSINFFIRIFYRAD